MKLAILLLLTSCASKYHVICKDKYSGQVTEYKLDKFSLTRTQLLFTQGEVDNEEDISQCEVEN